MTAELQWNFAIDDRGCALLAVTTADAQVETVEPGEYLVTLPVAVAREFGVEADVAGDAGFIAAAPGDDLGNKPNTLRVLTMNDETFGPRPFTIILRTR